MKKIYHSEPLCEFSELSVSYTTGAQRSASSAGTAASIALSATIAVSGSVEVISATAAVSTAFSAAAGAASAVFFGAAAFILAVPESSKGSLPGGIQFSSLHAA